MSTELQKRAAFASGWHYGNEHKQEASAREASTLHPEYDADQIDRFCQGTVDGKAWDTFRLLFRKAVPYH